jgi:alanyl-tRNA synthetase
MTTEKLYYEDSHLSAFTARVLRCEGNAAVLDRTAFFPEGGGQRADTGSIGPTRVTDVQEKDGEILHYLDTPLREGAEYPCAVDWETRFRRMQNHSGEHIVSGLVHKIYGYDNVGFHMGEHTVTIDFSGEIDREGLSRLELLANEAVTRNIPVRTEFPSAEALAAMDYRSKKELTGDVRIVTIEGVDVCACCAPHVARTGEIGLIKFLSYMRHRGGVRIDMVCGRDALLDYRQKHESVEAVSRALSAKQPEVAAAVDRLAGECAELRLRCGELSREAVRARLGAMEETEGNICIFDSTLDEPALRELVNGAAQKCVGVAAVFYGAGEGGYRYIIGSTHCDLRSRTTEINAGIGGRGGGSAGMIQGSASKSAREIQDFLRKLQN